jgi:hypothetical protein
LNQYHIHHVHRSSRNVDDGAAKSVRRAQRFDPMASKNENVDVNLWLPGIQGKSSIHLHHLEI